MDDAERQLILWKEFQARWNMAYEPGQKLGRDQRYGLKKRIGEGSYGVVWLAEDLQLGRPVAVKTLHPFRGRLADLEREAKAQAQLVHPNIVIIYGVDVDERFIAMEYVEGESLEECLKEHIRKSTWIATEKATAWLLQCFRAIKCAHAKGVVHGDIKPGNVMIDRDGTVRMTDFGVAKIISEEKQDTYRLEEPRRVGSITYSAPEVLRGGHRNYVSDMFSMGILAYLLLTGHHPFFNVHPSGLFSVTDMLLSDDRARDPKDINPDITENHARVILKLIEKDPEARYPNIQQAFDEFADIGLSCPKCRSKNDLVAKYCNQCGRVLRGLEDQYKGKTAQELSAIAFDLNGAGQYEQAISFADAAVRANPDFPLAHQTKGFSLSSIGKYPEALDSFNRTLELMQKEPYCDVRKIVNVLLSKCFCYERLADYPKSKQSLDEALKYDPDHPKAKLLLERGHQKGYW